ncbi:MAG: hypothetical protein JRG96_06315 [Deltaproteobacteria bacterium]|nr:hypothetical protein [Deltaproteobacteria bacterium]
MSRGEDTRAALSRRGKDTQSGAAPALAASIDRLRAARPELAAWPAEQRLDALCAVLELWRPSDSPYRKELEEKLPRESGFHPETVRAGLELGLSHWSGDALRAVVAGELGFGATAPPAYPRRGATACGFPLTSVLLAGSIPMPTLLSLLLPLVLGSPVLAKPASRDPVTADLVAASLAEIDPLLGRCVALNTFSHDDEAAAALFFASECVVATGSDETLARVATRVAPPQRLVAYGHRLSLAVVSGAAMRGDALRETAAGLATDIALWDQLGCLSPLVVFVEGEHAGAALADELARALAAAGRRWPRGDLSTAAAAQIRSERSEAEMRRAAGRALRVHACEELGWTVVLEDDASQRPAPLHRFVRVSPVSSRAELLCALQPLAPHLAGVALAGFGGETRELSRALLDLGASRVCAPGRLQAPPLGWHHDGQPLLLPLARLGDYEID